jgi:ATP-binding cassette subfamily B protein
MYGALAVVCYMSYGLLKETVITMGEVTQFIFYTQSLIFQFWMMSFVIGNVMGVRGVNEALSKIRNNIPEILNTDGDIIEDESAITGNLSLENVTFSYPEKKDVVALDNVSIEVNN